MSCSIAIALLCFELSGVYVDGSLAAADSGVEVYTLERTLVTREYRGFTRFVGSSEERSFSDEARNPYGRLALGYEQTFFSPDLRLSAELFHESSLATGRDRGVNGARVSLRWYPFGGAR